MEKSSSKFILEAREKLDSFKNKPLSPESREKEAVDLAALLLKEALRVQTHAEKKAQAEIARMMQDPRGKAFTMLMTDECFRSKRTSRIANQLVYLLDQFGVPRYLNWFQRLELKLFKYLGIPFHFILVPLAKRALRKTTSKVILPGERAALSAHMHKRRQEGVRLNLNHLGEAILGEEEALHRLKMYLHDLEQPDVEYISIKISTIFSQINILDWDKTLEILADRLRQLYRNAMKYKFQRADGTEVVKFVNLDMEEYRDLHITKELFKKVLSEEEFFQFSAGIVLQAYLADSFPIQKELTEWALDRRKKGGAPVKIRIVKGANLAMEQFEASIHDWPQTPYKTKHEVDANYKRMVLYACQKEHADAVRIGVGSHNLFDISYALIARAENGVEEEIAFEMLEGMADHVRRVVQHVSGDMLLYCPIATKEDFQSAIAYLIRRLDENTGPENFLRHSFGLQPGTSAWKEQVHIFEKACHDINIVAAEPRRKQNRYNPPEHLPMDAPYRCEADTDFALPQNQRWAHEVVNKWKNLTFPSIPLVIDGKDFHRDQKEKGVDPSKPDQTLYEYSLASWEDMDYALNTAKNKEDYWSHLSVHHRCELISSVARKMREKRADLVGVMMKDGGKTIFETEPEISEAIDFAEYYLRNMLHLHEMKELSFKPMGTILVTPPWNFPISIPAGGIIAGLVTGHCVIFKPAPEAVLCGWVLVNIFWEAGIPRDVLQFVNCVDDPVGSKLIQDKRINTVILTGGTSTARLFLKMRPTLHLCAETGGKNAIVITGMADRDLAIKDLIQSAFGHSGQKCSAASLAILEAEVYDDPVFRRQFKDAVESIHVGSQWDLSSKVIPVIRLAEGALQQGFTTLDKGEEWLVEPKQDPTNPLLWSPGVKFGVKEGSFMHQTELFGPVLGVMRAKNLEHALKLANGTPYGLTSGIHSLDKREIRYWIKHIEAGNCYVNRGITGAIVERQPFGGYKGSAYGLSPKAGGPNYLSQLLYKQQKELPIEIDEICPDVELLTPLLQKLHLSTEDLSTWTASIQSYAYYAKYYSQDHDPSKIVGEDNFLRFRPRHRLSLRIQKTDRPLDIFRIIAAALSTNAHLEVSYDTQNSPIDMHMLEKAVREYPFIEENEDKWLARLQRGNFERVRFASKPTNKMYEDASVSATYLDAEPVLASGRFELLHYLREIALSIDYHRYGNLGTREGETRAPIK